MQWLNITLFFGYHSLIIIISVCKMNLILNIMMHLGWKMTDIFLFCISNKLALHLHSARIYLPKPANVETWRNNFLKWKLFAQFDLWNVYQSISIVCTGAICYFLFSFHLQIIRALIRSLKKKTLTWTDAGTQITPSEQFYSLRLYFFAETSWSDANQSIIVPIPKWKI